MIDYQKAVDEFEEDPQDQNLKLQAKSISSRDKNLFDVGS